ncbi:putative methyltransferase-domain-containing protein [Cristinia sonorae]|uniref:Methyltransferase-domain-containing protein n=1 Tax=Cristinia sonorae TaxID=1940300 RepID=A0A8K0XJZ8_9AGAR|nr:putative methyltransferase-domain-containing protein [Cristinia sonorae]
MTLEVADFFADSLQSLYDYTPITLASSGSIFTYTPPSLGISDLSTHQPIDAKSIPSQHVITLKTPETQANNWSLHASSIWASSIYLADHLIDLRIPDLLASARDHPDYGSTPPLRVLELGAGAGLPSIQIAASYAPEDVQVTVSDYPDPDLIRTLKENVSLNEVTRNCRVVPYAWGTDPTPLLSPNGEGFDLILAADTLWNSDFHPGLLQTLSNTLRRASHARVQLVAGLHTGRYTLQRFLDLLPKYGLVAEVLEERGVGNNDGERRGWDLGRAEGEDERERRRWVLWITLRWDRV